jgi:hypothetical protein
MTRSRLLSLSVLCAVALTACTVPASPSAQAVVVVVAPRTTQPQPLLSDDDRMLLRNLAAVDGSTVRLLVAGADAAGRTVDLTPYRELGGGRREVEHGPRRDALIAAALATVDADLAAEAPTTGAPDLLGAVGHAAALNPGGTMIVQDSGIGTVDPVDMRVLGWDTPAGTVVKDLHTRGLIPDLTGWHVRFAGLGQVAGAQPEPPLPQRHWLAQLWLGICRAGGAVECVEAAATPGGPPRSTRVAPVVPVPDVITRKGADGTVVAVLPAARLGFTEGSAVLPADADPALDEVVALASSADYRVEVAGYVAYWGTADYRQELSTARAGAVADRIVSRGVPASLVDAVGRGAADGPDASRSRGVFDEAKVRAAGLRRVVITLTPVRSGPA